jgi:hypothetical protein
MWYVYKKTLAFGLALVLGVGLFSSGVGAFSDCGPKSCCCDLTQEIHHHNQAVPVAPEKGCRHANCGIENGAGTRSPVMVTASTGFSGQSLFVSDGVAGEHQMPANQRASKRFCCHPPPRDGLIPLYLKNLSFIC